MQRTSLPATLLLLAPLCPVRAAGVGPAAAPFDAAVEARIQAERLDASARAELDYQRRSGALERALDELDGQLEEVPGDAPCRALRARCLFERGQHVEALADARRALEDARTGALDADERSACVRTWLELATRLGRPTEALEALGALADVLRPDADPRDAWVLGRTRLAAGRRSEAEDALRRGVQARAEPGWETELARARCERAVGLFERAAATLVRADELARAGSFHSSVAEVLVELGDVYFEAYGEVDQEVSKAHSPAELCREALLLDRDDEGARLLLFRLHRWNWQRASQSPEEILQALFASHPGSIDGRLARASAALDDGDLPTARDDLAWLAQVAPGRRDVRTEQAALAWIEHRRDDARGILEGLLASDDKDSRPELTVGWHLLELYRFSEALGFLQRSVERDPRDWMAWIQLGRAYANTGDEDKAREALARSVEVGEGRLNAWRDNTALVLKRMKESMVLSDHGELRFLWRPDEGGVLESYLPDFYGRAREELAARYGHTPGVTRIEVFRNWADFSVRSTGFEGYPALGVCFGPVVTAVSPLSELRGTFSWARTSFHEFTHVIHLGLSNNRCPRWVTEGLATWEEGTRKKSWWRNLRRDLLDARANADIVPLRRLNSAFRGPRVIFAYYQSGLLCQMLIEENGFPPVVRLLEAFDRGADLDQAFREVYQRSPEEIDRAFAAYVDRVLADLAIEPRWSPEVTFRLRFGLAREAPSAPDLRTTWADDWCKVAWGSYLQRKRVDAEEALRLAGLAGPLPPRGEFLRGELALARADGDAAALAFEAGLAQGGEDYRARMALGSIRARKGERSEALAQFQAAERAFPGFPDGHFSAELEQARLLEQGGDVPAAMAARRRWLEWNSGDYPVRVKVADWLDATGQPEQSVVLWEEANEVDPFRRHMHLAWGRALAQLGRHEEALREFHVGLAVREPLDGDVLLGGSEELSRAELMALAGVSEEEWESLSEEERQMRVKAGIERAKAEGRERPESGAAIRFRAEEPVLHGLAALEALALGRVEEARASCEQALELDPACEPALRARAQLP